MAENISPELQKQLDGIRQRQDEQDKKNASLEAENLKLKQQLAELASKGADEAADESNEPVIPEETFTVNKRKFKFTAAKFIVPGINESVTATDALADDTKYKKLVVEGKGDLTIKEYLVAVESELIEAVEA